MRNFLDRYGKLHFIVHTMIFLVALIVANSVIQLTLVNMAHAASHNLIVGERQRAAPTNEPKITVEPVDDGDARCDDPTYAMLFCDAHHHILPLE